VNFNKNINIKYKFGFNLENDKIAPFKKIGIKLTKK